MMTDIDKTEAELLKQKLRYYESITVNWMMGRQIPSASMQKSILHLTDTSTASEAYTELLEMWKVLEAFERLSRIGRFMK